jgi:hypothetical protein
MAVKIDVTKESAAVFVDATDGDQLIYRVTPRGATPIFTLVDSQANRLLLSHKDNPVATMPDEIFERRWPLPVDLTLQVTSHTMGFHFLGAVSYKYEVIKIKGTGQTESIINITYSSNSPEDAFFQALQVTTV